MDKKILIANFLKSQKHMVISTVNSKNNPESALVGFAAIDDLSIIFGTTIKTRKYTNLMNNSNVSIVFDDDDAITVQYEGIVTKLEGEELAKYKNVYFKKNPSAKKYEKYDGEVYLKVIPKW